MALGDGGQEGAGLLGLTAQPVSQNGRLIPQLPAGLSSRGAQFPHTAGDDSLHIVQLLGSLHIQQSLHLVGEGEVVFFHSGPGIFPGRAVGISRSGGDHIQRIAQNVRQNDGVHLGGGAQLGKFAALDCGETLAQGVHLHNVCPAGQQILGKPGQILAGDQGTFKQGRAAARDQKDHSVLCSKILNQIHGGPGAAEGIFIRDGVTAFINRAAGNFALAVVVLGDHHAGGEAVSQHLGSALSHLPGCFSGSDQIDPTTGKFFALQGAAYGCIGQTGGQSALNDLLRIGTSGHRADSFPTGSIG